MTTSTTGKLETWVRDEYFAGEADDFAGSLALVVKARDIDAEMAALVEVAEAYERWEADLIMESRCWVDGLPRLTQDMYDAAIAIQTTRNAALARVRGTA